MADILCFLANANAAMYVTVYKTKLKKRYFEGKAKTILRAEDPYRAYVEP